MIITREQKVAMLANDRTQLFHAIKRRVERDYQAIVQGVPEDMLAGMINHGIDSAKGFGMTHPYDIAGFVYLMFERRKNHREDIGPEEAHRRQCGEGTANRRQHTQRRCRRDPCQTGS